MTQQSSPSAPPLSATIPAILLGAFLLPFSLGAQTFTAITQRTSDRNLQQAYQWLDETQLLSSFAEHLDNSVKLPRNVTLTARQCGRQNAFYDPSSEFGGPAIVLCYELVEDIFDEFQYESTSKEQQGQAIAGAVSFVLMHEVGHALINQHQLPITGREENVADQFATLALRSQPAFAVGAARYFRDAGDFGDLGLKTWSFSSDHFGDEHALGQQRFYNILCWTYGVNPGGRDYLVRNSLLPRDRARRCQSELQQMKRAFQHLAGQYVNFGFDSASTSQSQAKVPTIEGRWSFSEQFSNDSGQAACLSEGTLRFNQTVSGAWEASMRQTGWCQFSGERTSNDGTFTISDVELSRDSIQMRAETCVYHGAFRSGDREIEGKVTCNVTVDGEPVEMTGTWSAAAKN